MLAKKYRLTGRDIQYMLRRGNKTRGKYFGCMTVPQYPSKSYHQRSIQISVKVDKRAVMRNELKRIAREVFEQQLSNQGNATKKHLKRFVFINKKGVDEWAQKLTKLPKSDRKTLWKSYCINDFTSMLPKCLSSQGSTPRFRPGKSGGRPSLRNNARPSGRNR